MTEEFTLQGWRELVLCAPVRHIGLYEADAYASWADARLPTEQEWEVAAQNGLPGTGSVWEWTNSQFFPYDGFKIDVYPFMSTLQFGDHKVSRGGGCATSPNLIRGTYRQAYLAERNDVYTGFRTCALPDT